MYCEIELIRDNEADYLHLVPQVPLPKITYLQFRSYCLKLLPVAERHRWLLSDRKRLHHPSLCWLA
jgi:hypothetical protein